MQPRQEFAQNTKRGDRVKGPKSITDFGVFVVWLPAIDGTFTCPTCPERSWRSRRSQLQEGPGGCHRAGRGFGPRTHQPGIKQLGWRPFTTFVSVNDKGSVVTGKVKTVDAKGARSRIQGEDVLHLRPPEISRDRGRCPQR